MSSKALECGIITRMGSELICLNYSSSFYTSLTSKLRQSESSAISSISILNSNKSTNLNNASDIDVRIQTSRSGPRRKAGKKKRAQSINLFLFIILYLFSSFQLFTTELYTENLSRTFVWNWSTNGSIMYVIRIENRACLNGAAICYCPPALFSIPFRKPGKSYRDIEFGL